MAIVFSGSANAKQYFQFHANANNHNHPEVINNHFLSSNEEQPIFKSNHKRERAGLSGISGTSGYGWDECEFSPLSCLLRKRRSTKF
uniref:Uncharacterized protein n=1 Tax=Rhabditophanes sp. KR3021 TaxID=114890 RepID=A0AC35U3S6_9BILA